MKRMKGVILFFFCLLWNLVIPDAILAQQVSYHSSHIKLAAQAIGQIDLASAPVGSSIVVRNGSIRIVVRKNERGEVEHIGRKLFPTEIRELHPSPVYDYLEYAYLNQTYQFIENPFIYKDFHFLAGTWKMLDNITDDTAFGISVENRTHYRVSWQFPNGKDVEVVFPIDYDKLTMESRRELENNLIRELKRHEATDVFDLPKIEKKSLVAVPGTTLLMVPGEMYLKKEINQNLYVENSTSTPIWLWTRDYPAESLGNLLLTKSSFDSNARISITFLKYENMNETIELSLRSVIDFFEKNGCKLYWGSEEVNSTEVKGSLFIYNASYGFDHVLKISCPLQNIGKRNGKMAAKASLFIPTTNVSNLFYKYTPQKSTKKVF